MIEEWKKIYSENKKLDQSFYDSYSNDSEFLKKNCLEFLVELGEFVNETKIFKYWSVKNADKDKVLEELADCLTMILFFYNYLNMNIENINIIKIDNIFEAINDLYFKGTKLMTDLNSSIVKNIFNNLLSVAFALNLKEIEIIEAIKNKQKIVRERLNNCNY